MIEIVPDDLAALTAVQQDLPGRHSAQVYLRDFLDTCPMKDEFQCYTVSVPGAMATMIYRGLEDYLRRGHGSKATQQKVRHLMVKLLTCGVEQHSGPMNM